MSINYEQELIKLIENNGITVLPSIEVMSSSKDVALAAWKNYYYHYDSDYQNFDLHTWYKGVDWPKNLLAYKNDVNFWKEALTKNFDTYYGKFAYNLLLEDCFKKDFPEIVEILLKDNELLSNAFKSTKNDFFYNLIELPEQDKIEIYKDYLLNPDRFPDYEKIKPFLSDKEFLFKALEKFSGIYHYLNEEQKNDDEIIVKAIQRNKDNVYLIPEEKRIGYLEDLVKNQSYTKLNFKKLNTKEILMIIDNKPELLEQSRSSLNPKDLKRVTLQMLNKDFKKTLSQMHPNDIVKLFNKKENLDYIKDELVQFISNYKKISNTFDNGEEKIIGLISLDEDLTKQLNENLFYKFSVAKKHTLNIDNLKEMYQHLKGEYDNGMEIETINKILVNTKEKMNLADLKEHRISNKNIFQYFRTIEMKENLDNDLEIKDTNIKKNKI